MDAEHDRVVSEITEGLRFLSLRQLETVLVVVRNLNIPVEFFPNASSSIVDSIFSEEMSHLLSVHHSNHEAPLSKKPFEYVIKRCLIAQGYAEADLNPKPGESAFDVFGNGERWSLKTEAAKSLNRNQVRIEKFSEARWVREVVTPEQCAAEIRDRLPRHMEGYDRILVLRAETRADSFVYTLEEIPKELLMECFKSATPDMFSKKVRGEQEAVSFGADFYHHSTREKVFRILLDSSVEKIRLWYQLKYCIRHGTWIVPRGEASSAQIKLA